MEFAKFEKLSLRSTSGLDEKWVQERIAEDPSILGLGDLILKDKERVQPRAGRLDLLLQDADSSRRYEVELQLGSTDESHIIRTIEYWDIERKRYPQYDHTAVIVAEDITSRFLNVVSLFNGAIPLVAIQMKALKIEDKVGLFFTTVLDQMTLGLVDEDEDLQEITDRSYWDSRASTKTVAIADELLELARECDSDLELAYKKFYIGIAKNGQPNNFYRVRPKKKFVWLEPRMKQSSEMDELLEQSGLDSAEYNSRRGRYFIRLEPGYVEKYKEAITNVIKEAYESSSRS